MGCWSVDSFWWCLPSCYWFPPCWPSLSLAVSELWNSLHLAPLCWSLVSRRALCVCVYVWIRLQRALGVCEYMFVCNCVSEREKKNTNQIKVLKVSVCLVPTFEFIKAYSAELYKTMSGQTEQIPLSLTYGRLHFAGTFLGISDSKERS